jgi:4-hydroxy-3-methylbut-2-enyl diphosphate reductase
MAADTYTPIEEDFNFEEALKLSFKKLHTGERVKGIVAAINNKEIIVDTGTKQTGYIPFSELLPTDDFQLEDIIEVVVTKINDAEGTVLLSRKKLGETASFDALVKAKNEQLVLNGVVTNIVSGGVLAAVLNSDGGQVGLRVFIPASQTGLSKDADLATLLKQKVNFKILDVNETRRRSLGSIRAVNNKGIGSAKFWSTAQVGDVFKGRVKSFTNYGAFIDIGGVDGMVHISELSYGRISHPKDVLTIDQEIEVYVKSINKTQHKIALGYKKPEDNPWLNMEEKYNVGDRVDVTIFSIKNFGAFASLEPGLDGLIHISQVADRKVANVTDAVKVGEVVNAMIIALDVPNKRINLSLRKDAAPLADPEPISETAEVVYSTEETVAPTPENE